MQEKIEDAKPENLHYNTLICLVCASRSVVPDPLRPDGLQPTTLLCSWDSPSKNTGVVCHSLLQGSNLGALQCRQILYHLSHQVINI